MKSIPHNSAEEARFYVRQELDLVADLDVPEDLRVPAFTKAVDLFAAKQLFIDQREASSPVMPAMAIPGKRH